MSINEEAAERSLSSRENQNSGDNIARPENPNALGRVSMVDYKDVAIGNVEIYPSSFPSEGLFYPKDLRVFIKPPTVAAIRAYSVMDDTNHLAVVDAFNDILRNSVLCKSSTGFTYRNILDEDRMHLILAVKEITFLKGENELIMNLPCKCDNGFDVTISSSSLEVETKDPEVMRYYDPDSRMFIFETRDFGKISIKPPSIDVMQLMTDYIRELGGAGKSIDMYMYKIVPYIIEPYLAHDRRTAIRNAEQEIISWSDKKTSFMYSLLSKLKMGYKESLSGICPKCNTQSASRVTFPRGPKAIFVISDISSQLI